jgi:predicted acylesterase/phospholipase RssA
MNLNNFNFFNLFKKFGIDDGKKFIFVLEKLIEKKIGKNDITFDELYKTKGKELIVCATCLNDRNSRYFSYKNDPEMSILTAIRMSISIPYMYTPVLYNDKLYSDGAILDNYPIQLTANVETTIGIYIESEIEYNNIDNLECFTFSILSCLMKDSTDKIEKYKKNTIYIKTNRSVIQFEMSFDEKKELIDIGYAFAKDYDMQQLAIS